MNLITYCIAKFRIWKNMQELKKEGKISNFKIKYNKSAQRFLVEYDIIETDCIDIDSEVIDEDEKQEEI